MNTPVVLTIELGQLSGEMGFLLDDSAEDELAIPSGPMCDDEGFEGMVFSRISNPVGPYGTVVDFRNCSASQFQFLLDQNEIKYTLLTTPKPIATA
ncbi:MAG: hypothetical protein CMH98_06820 [Oceanospirillaceae bacterium]|nr:hypothetical protein [Oceanospirillaceae bacterium]